MEVTQASRGAAQLNVTSEAPFLRPTYDVAYQILLIRLGGLLDVLKQISIFLP